jgi:hypothetical protein
MSKEKSRKRPAITVVEAVKYATIRQGTAGRKEFARRFTMDGQEILILGISFAQNLAGFPNAPRQYRIETFVDGRWKGGMLL